MDKIGIIRSESKGNESSKHKRMAERQRYKFVKAFHTSSKIEKVVYIKAHKKWGVNSRSYLLHSSFEMMYEEMTKNRDKEDE